MPSFHVILELVTRLPQVVAAAPEFKELFDQFIQIFSDDEQEQLKNAYQAARDQSDSAQAEFEKAARGEE